MANGNVAAGWDWATIIGAIVNGITSAWQAQQQRIAAEEQARLAQLQAQQAQYQAYLAQLQQQQLQMQQQAQTQKIITYTIIGVGVILAAFALYYAFAARSY
jgi:uncharacterized protein YlxW (UPF0749 family)